MTRLTFALFILTRFTFSANAQVRMPQPSTTQTIKQEFGMGTIELTYSRPNAKGRKIYGDLVPYNKLWRTGANSATTLKFTDAVELAGKKIDTGTYALYTIPGVDSWEIILNKGINNWGVDGYNETDDVVRFKVIPLKAKNRAESFTMQFTDIKNESCGLEIIWDKTIVTIPITTNIKDRLRKQIETALQGDKKPYWQAAQFYNEYENNQNKALEYITKALQENDQAFWMWLYKAKIQQEMGDKVGAKVSALKSLDLSKEANNNDYIKMNQELLKKL
jgi:hypothetical protein